MVGARLTDCDSTRELMRSFHHSQYALERLLEQKRETITVVLPTREVADTIGPIVERLQGLAPLIDQILVTDAGSTDGSAEIAVAGGAEVRQESELLAGFGPVLGKGDAMWRSLAVARGDLVVYLDSDTPDFSPHFATGLLGPLICEPRVRFVKGYFRRPFASPDGRGYPPSSPTWPASPSRSPARWPPGASSSSGSPSPPATRSRPRCSCTRVRLSAAPPAWRRWTSSSGATATSRSRPWPRWPARCSARSWRSCPPTVACSTATTRRPSSGRRM